MSYPEHMMKECIVKVPYQASVPKYETVQEPYDAIELVMEPYQDCRYDYYSKTNICNTQYRQVNKTVTRYRTKLVSRQVIVTKYRDDPRVFYYDGKRHEEKIHFDLKLNGTIDGQPVCITAIDSDNNTSISHNASFPDAGVFPEASSLIDIPEWLDGVYAKIENEFTKKFKEVWNIRYCKNNETVTNESEKIERINRCGKVAPDNLFVNTWYKNTFGYDYVDYWERVKNTAFRDITGITH